MRYSPERKEAVLNKMMPPHNQSIKQLALEEGISEETALRRAARKERMTGYLNQRRQRQSLQG